MNYDEQSRNADRLKTRDRTNKGMEKKDNMVSNEDEVDKCERFEIVVMGRQEVTGR